MYAAFPQGPNVGSVQLQGFAFCPSDGPGQHKRDMGVWIILSSLRFCNHLLRLFNGCFVSMLNRFSSPILIACDYRLEK